MRFLLQVQVLVLEFQAYNLALALVLDVGLVLDLAMVWVGALRRMRIRDTQIF